MKGFGSRGFGSKKRMRKFEEGGPTDYAESGSAGGTNISFGAAFRAARKQGLKTFTWRGKEYTTDTKEDKAKPKAEAKTSSRQAEPEEFAAQMNMRLADQGKILPDSYMPKNSLRGKYPELDRVAKGPKTRGGRRSGSSDSETSEKTDERIGASIRGSTSSMKKSDSVYERLARGPNEAERKAKRVNEARESMSYRKGGSVGSASKRADGIAQRGKTRGKMC